MHHTYVLENNPDPRLDLDLHDSLVLECFAKHFCCLQEGLLPPFHVLFLA